MAAVSRRSLLLASPVLVAVVLASALVAVSFVASRSLRARDDAVRDGLLAKTGHELESLLRESGSGAALETLAAFGRENARLLRGIAVESGPATIVRWGALEGSPFEMPAMLGPGWRGMAGGRGGGPGIGRSPFTLRLFPVPDAGRAARLPAVLVLGSILAGVGLVAFALFAARGLAATCAQTFVVVEVENLTQKTLLKLRNADGTPVFAGGGYGQGHGRGGQGNGGTCPNPDCPYRS